MANGWSWPLGIVGVLALIGLTGSALAMPKVRWWWLALLWVASAAGVWFFVWVVSRGGFVPLHED